MNTIEMPPFWDIAFVTMDKFARALRTRPCFSATISLTNSLTNLS